MKTLLVGITLSAVCPRSIAHEELLVAKGVVESAVPLNDVDGDGVNDIAAGGTAGVTTGGETVIFSGRTGQRLLVLSES